MQSTEAALHFDESKDIIQTQKKEPGMIPGSFLKSVIYNCLVAWIF